jgi:hypothetical protein
MDDSVEAFIEILKKKMPDKDLLSGYDLISLGLMNNQASVCHSRQDGTGPSFIKIGKRAYRYLPEDVYKWIRLRYVQSKCETPEETT